MPTVAVLIPCYNEEKTIRKVIEDYRRVLPDSFIYVYNNNSKDNTAKIVQKLIKTDQKLILRHEYRQGKGNVIRSMFRDINADCYIITDGDDTYPAENAPEMVEYILSGRADMVIGDRLSATYFTENKRPFHNIGNVIVRNLINKLFNSNINDIMTGYRAFNRTFIKGFPVLSKGFEIETEMTIHAVDKNFLLKEVPVPYRNRPLGSQSKLNTYSDGFKVIKTIFMLFKDYKPLVFFSTAACILMFITLCFFIPVLIDYTRTGLVAKFPTLIVSGVFGTSALLSFLVGVILDVEVKKHKQLYEVLMNYYLSNDNGGNK